MGFVRATKHESKLRLALAGPAGSGKTWTALTLATALADGQGVALIDTEHHSASKYADVFEFDSQDLTVFHPQKYIDAIHEAEKAGYAVLVIDSLSHAWSGTGGVLELVENITKRSTNKNSFNAWGEATPWQNRLIEAIIQAKLHVICTMRSKTEYVIELNNAGKSVPRKVGTAPVQRADVEYEFDVYADMNAANEMIVQKSRCPVLSGMIIPKPGKEVADILREWLKGDPMPERPEYDPEIHQETQQKPPVVQTVNTSSSSQGVSQSSNGQETSLWNAERKAKIDILYTRGNKLELFNDVGTFLGYLGRILERTVSTVKTLSDDELYRIGLDLTRRERETQPQEAA